MRVTMIGAGYVGLVSGACFADFGHQVICIDKDARRIAALKNGEIPIFEPGLADLVEANVRLEFTDETSRVAKADAIFIAAVAPGRWICRSEFRLRGGARDCRAHFRYGRRRHQIDCAGWHRR